MHSKNGTYQFMVCAFSGVRPNREGEMKMELVFEYRKWGKGSSSYSVSVATHYDVISRRFTYKTIGNVEKQGNQWIGTSGNLEVIGKTRKEVSEMLKGMK